MPTPTKEGAPPQDAVADINAEVYKDDPVSKECKFCGKECASSESRKQHVCRCVKRRKFCRFCGKIVLNMPSLKVHEESCVMLSEVMKRRKDMAPFSQFYYRIDQEEGDETTVAKVVEKLPAPQTQTEEEPFTRKADNFILKKTMSTHQLFICGLCEESFPTKEECRKHTKEAHQAQIATATPPATNLAEKEAEAAKRKASNESLPPAKKKKSSKKVKATLREALTNFSDEEILAKLLERNATFVCKCGVIFKDQTLFYLHRGTHSSKNPYECSFCGHVAPNWYDFTSHFYFHTKQKKDSTAS